MGITGAYIKDLGYTPAAWWKTAITDAKGVTFGTDAQIRAFLDTYLTPTVTFSETPAPLTFNIDAESPEETDNVFKVGEHMRAIVRLPTVVSAAVMPDACPVGGPLGTIPVGGVVKTLNAIHPDMHSADICCSMAASFYAFNVDPTALLDAGMKLSHFGPGGRDRDQQLRIPTAILEGFAGNPFLREHTKVAREHFGTQGDGNHFFYVGKSWNNGAIALVTHHGSRKPGALLYKAGMACAEKFRRKIAPTIPHHNAWIPADTQEGQDYWAALQLIREWTKRSHYAIHDHVAESLGIFHIERFWNEHNFVFKRDGHFLHGKGATPAWRKFAPDSHGLTLIPLNMAEPILIVVGRDNPNALGFSPHGAGRNMSRSKFAKLNEDKTAAEMIAEQAPGIDVRYFNGKPDISELPGAYKSAAAVRAQIAKYGLADIVDEIMPIGSIMAGDTSWRARKQR